MIEAKPSDNLEACQLLTIMIVSKKSVTYFCGKVHLKRLFPRVSPIVQKQRVSFDSIHQNHNCNCSFLLT